MHVHSNPVAGPVRQARQAIVFAPALPFVECADCPVDGADRNAGLRGLECDLLAPLHGVPNLPLTRRDIAEYPAPGDVGLVAVNAAASVDEDHGSLAHFLRFYGPMRIGARLIEQYQRNFMRAAQLLSGR